MYSKTRYNAYSRKIIYDWKMDPAESKPARGKILSYIKTRKDGRKHAEAIKACRKRSGQEDSTTDGSTGTTDGTTERAAKILYVSWKGTHRQRYTRHRRRTDGSRAGRRRICRKTGARFCIIACRDTDARKAARSFCRIASACCAGSLRR